MIKHGLFLLFIKHTDATYNFCVFSIFSIMQQTVVANYILSFISSQNITPALG